VSADRFVSVQYCDDIRQELGNKFSLIGCYGPMIQVHPLPSVLPKLCASIKVYTPIERPFGKCVVRILRGDSAIAELAFANDSALPPPLHMEGARWQVAIAMIIMSPFPVEAACTLRVEVETEEGTLSGGTTWINAADLPTPAPELPAPAT
jgi:hypothetical protein